jgi:hypothetical protein
VASIKDSDVGAAEDESTAPCKCLIIYDGKLDSELGPYGDVCKTTALRQASLKRLVTCVRLARPSQQIGKVLQQGDVLAVMDSFALGSSIGQILEAVSAEVVPADDHEPEESARKKRKANRRKVFDFQRMLKIVYSEENLLARRTRTSRAFMGVRQVEGMLCFSSTSKMSDLRARENLHHPGCTDGKMLREK